MTAICETIELRDGRHLAYRAYGPADGTPVLFIPGAGSGRLMRFGDDALLSRRGVQLISVDRPGLGGSTGDPAKTFGSVADDLGELARTVAGGPVPVVANSQGAPFGLALAATSWARRLVLVSPIDDVAHPPITALLPAAYREMVAGVAADPHALAADLRHYTADALYAMVMSDYPDCDAEVYTRTDFRSHFESALQDAFAGGATGYAQDTVLAMTAWPAELFHPTVDVHILFGSEDTVHSPDFGAQLTSRIRGARREVVAGTGGALLWARPDLVLDRVFAL
jgi:pimeloyl-ACP methyl ester carboxylesterase